MARERRAGQGRGKLIWGVRVALLYPLWSRTCQQCERFVYGADGLLRYDHKGNPQERKAHLPTPCGSCPKVPDAAKQVTHHWRELRRKAEDMTPENRAAYKAYKSFKATGRFPDDPIVTWYSGIIREMEDAVENRNHSRVSDQLVILLEVMKVRGARC